MSACTASRYWLRRLWRETSGQEIVPPTWWVAIMVLPALGPARYWAAALFLPFVLASVLSLRHFLGSAQGREPASLDVLTAVLAAFVLFKGTFLPLVLAAVGAAALDRMCRGRRAGRSLAVFVAATLCWWALAGPRMRDLPVYLSGTWDLIGGYRDVAGLRCAYDWTSTKVLALSMLVALGFFVRMAARRLGPRAILPAGVLAITYLTILEHGFVRAEPEHIVAAYLSFGSTTLLIAPALVSASVHGESRHAAVLLFAGLLVASVYGVSFVGEPRMGALVDGPRALWTLATHGIAALDDAAAEHARTIRRAHPLPRLAEPVDCSAIDFGLADSSGWQSIVKPTVMNCSAFTPEHSRRNALYYSDPAGPATVVLSNLGAIDDHYPSATDPIGLLGLRENFRATARIRDVLVLTRRQSPLHTRRVRIATTEAHLGQRVPIPDASGEVVVSIAMDRTPVGRVFAGLYKPPETAMLLETDQGNHVYRLAPELAREGMIVSPMLDDLSILQTFFGMAGGCMPAKVRAMTLACAHGSEWFYREPIRLVFDRLETH